MARVAALLRRRHTRSVPSDGLLRFGDVTIDPDRDTVTREGKGVSLTPVPTSSSWPWRSERELS